MAKMVQFPSRAKAYERAAAWVARIDSGSLSSEDENTLRGWLEADRRHREAFVELAAFWDEADVLAELAELFPLEEAETREPRPRTAYRWAAAAAATIALVAAAVLVTTRVSAPEPEAGRSAASYSADFRTPVGQHATEPLPDGSALMLNTDTEIDVDFTAADRDVFLRRGEAHFDVAHDPDRPFNVHVGGRIVQAVGTAFNIRFDRDGEIEVMVTDGEVRVTPASDGSARTAPRPGRVRTPAPLESDTRLVEGEVAVLGRYGPSRTAKASVLRLQPADVDIKLAWQRGMLIFRGERLDEMLDEVGRYTTTEFVLVDGELADLRVGGYFRAGDTAELLVALRDNFQIESERLSDDRVALRAAR